MTFLIESYLISFLHAVKWFQILLFKTNYSIKYYSFTFTQLGFEDMMFFIRKSIARYL